MKKILALSIAAILALSLVACGNKDDTSLGEGEELIGEGDVKVFEDFEYAAGTDGKNEIVGYTYTGTEPKAIVIPSEIGGMPVTSIGDEAFKAISTITSVTIPDTVKRIGEFAFFDCTGITEIVLPDSVTEICWGAFRDCTSLKKVTFSKELTKIGNDAFWGCVALEAVSFSDKLTEIGEGAFLGCAAISEVSIPASVTKIDICAFYGCSALAKVTFNGGATVLDPNLNDNKGEWRDPQVFGNCNEGLEIVAPKEYKAKELDENNKEVEVTRTSTAKAYAEKAGIKFTELVAQ